MRLQKSLKISLLIQKIYFLCILVTLLHILIVYLLNGQSITVFLTSVILAIYPIETGSLIVNLIFFILDIRAKKVENKVRKILLIIIPFVVLIVLKILLYKCGEVIAPTV